MRVRDWQDIMADVVERNVDAGDWRAVVGNRRGGVGEDFYVGHPDAGVYQLKTYAKNPFEVHGVGTRVARRIDEDIDPLFPRGQTGGRFAVQSPPEDESEAEQAAKELETVLETHADAPTTPGDLFDDMMEVLDSPAFGPMEYDQYDRPDRLDDLSDTFEEAESLLETEFEDIVTEDETDKGFY
ncbi:MAG: hypothetical protein ABEJ70_08775 [Halobacteriaceae archaeon]